MIPGSQLDVSLEEKIARERVEKSPLSFFIRRFNGSQESLSSNSIPKPDATINTRFDHKVED